MNDPHHSKEKRWQASDFPPGSLAHTAFSQEQPPPTVPMAMSLGVLGDLLWIRLPASRPLLAERVADEVQAAISADRELCPLSPWEVVAQVLWTPLLQDALMDFPRTGDQLVALCAVIREAYAWDGIDGENIRDALWDYPLPWLLEPNYRSIIEQVDQELMELVLMGTPGSVG